MGKISKMKKVEPVKPTEEVTAEDKRQMYHSFNESTMRMLGIVVDLRAAVYDKDLPEIGLSVEPAFSAAINGIVELNKAMRQVEAYYNVAEKKDAD